MKAAKVVIPEVLVSKGSSFQRALADHDRKKDCLKELELLVATDMQLILVQGSAGIRSKIIGFLKICVCYTYHIKFYSAVSDTC